MWYTYVVACSDGTYYAGVTTDLARRVMEHNEGTGAKYTRGRRPVKKVYHEEYENQSEAQKREVMIKRMTRAEKNILVATAIH